MTTRPQQSKVDAPRPASGSRRATATAAKKPARAAKRRRPHALELTTVEPAGDVVPKRSPPRAVPEEVAEVERPGTKPREDVLVCASGSVPEPDTRAEEPYGEIRPRDIEGID